MIANRNLDLISFFPYMVEELSSVGVNRWLLWGEYKIRYPMDMPIASSVITIGNGRSKRMSAVISVISQQIKRT